MDDRFQVQPLSDAASVSHARLRGSHWHWHSLKGRPSRPRSFLTTKADTREETNVSQVWILQGYPTYSRYLRAPAAAMPLFSAVCPSYLRALDPWLSGKRRAGLHGGGCAVLMPTSSRHRLRIWVGTLGCKYIRHLYSLAPYETVYWRLPQTHPGAMVR